MKKGQIVNPVGYAKYLAEFIHGKNGEFFTATEAIDAVMARVKGVSRSTVRPFVCPLLHDWTRREFLLRGTGDNGRFVYLGFAKPLPERLTHGEVVEAVWQVLRSATAPMRLRDICNAINPCSDKGFSTDVASVLHYWHNDKVLHRDDKPCRYTYRLTDAARARGMRPPCTYDKKPYPIPSDGNMAHV